MEDWVECYSSHSYAEEPTAVHWHGQRLAITEIENRWLSPHGKHFHVHTRGDREFELFYALSGDQWRISPR